MEYCSDAVWDQIWCLQVDLVDLLIGELTLAGIDILKRHQEDHRLPRLFVGLIEKLVPSFRP